MQKSDSSFEAMSLEELRFGLQMRLQSSGALDSMRAQLRSRILSELRGSTHIAAHTRASAKIRAINTIVADYLEQFQHMYSLSVFLAESNVDKDEYTVGDVEHLLGVTLAHNSEHAMLVQLFQKFWSRHPPKNAGVQTEDSRADAVETQLRDLDEQYRSRSPDSVIPFQKMEALMIKYRHDCDVRASERIKQEIERVRSTDIAEMKLREGERYREQLSSVREQMERTFKDRVDHMKLREEEMLRRVRDREREMETQEFQRRQQLLAEIEAVRVRESELKRSLELESQAIHLQEEQLKDKARIVDERYVSIDRAKRDLEARYERRAEDYRRTVEAAHADEIARLRSSRAEVEKALSSIEAERAIHENTQDEFEKAKLLIEKHSEDRRAFDDNQVEIVQIREQKRTLEAQVQAYLGIIEELKNTSEQRCERIEELEQHLEELKALVSKGNTSNTLDAKEVDERWRSRVQTLVGEVEARSEEAERARQLLEEEQLRVKFLERDLLELQSQARHQDELKPHVWQSFFRDGVESRSQIFPRPAWMDTPENFHPPRNHAHAASVGAPPLNVDEESNALHSSSRSSKTIDASELLTRAERMLSSIVKEEQSFPSPDLTLGSNQRRCGAEKIDLRPVAPQQSTISVPLDKVLNVDSPSVQRGNTSSIRATLNQVNSPGTNDHRREDGNLNLPRACQDTAIKDSHDLLCEYNAESEFLRKSPTNMFVEAVVAKSGLRSPVKIDEPGETRALGDNVNEDEKGSAMLAQKARVQTEVDARDHHIALEIKKSPKHEDPETLINETLATKDEQDQAQVVLLQIVAGQGEQVRNEKKAKEAEDIEARKAIERSAREVAEQAQERIESETRQKDAIAARAKYEKTQIGVAEIETKEGAQLQAKVHHNWDAQVTVEQEAIQGAELGDRGKVEREAKAEAFEREAREKAEHEQRELAQQEHQQKTEEDVISSRYAKVGNSEVEAKSNANDEDVPESSAALSQVRIQRELEARARKRREDERQDRLDRMREERAERAKRERRERAERERADRMNRNRSSTRSKANADFNVPVSRRVIKSELEDVSVEEEESKMRVEAEKRTVSKSPLQPEHDADMRPHQTQSHMAASESLFDDGDEDDTESIVDDVVFSAADDDEEYDIH